MSSINNFDDYINISQNISHPIKDTIKFSEIKGSNKSLTIQKYIKKVKPEGKEIITILFVGQTGSGKSTIINGYLNFLLGVLSTNVHRYKIVIGDAEKEKDQTKSQTNDLTIYDVESLLYPNKIFRLIDTPGFGDTGNLTIDINNLDKNNVDKSYFDKFETFFKEKLKNGKLHAVCFVLKSSENRFNIYQKLIFETITNLFGKDAVKNFLAIFTFSDGEENPNSKMLMMNNYEIFKEKENSKTSWYWCFNCQKYFCEVKSRVERSLFEFNIENFINFTSKIFLIQPIDIEMTQRNLTLKKQLTSIKDSIKNQHLNPLLIEYNLFNEKLTELNDQKNVVQQEKNNLKQLENSIQAEENSLKSKEKYINELEESVNDYRIKIQNINSEIELNKENLSLMKNLIRNLENEKEQENKEKKQLEMEKIKTEEKRKEIENNLEELKKENKNSEEIQELERKLQESQTKINQINKEVNNLIDKKNLIDNQIKDVIIKRENIDNTIIQSKNEINKMKKEQDDLQKQKKNLMKECNGLNFENNERQILYYENQIKNLENEKNEIKVVKDEYYESKKTNSNQNNLFCDTCKTTCCENCECNWVFFPGKNVNWFCHKIGYFDHICKICDHHSDSHKRGNQKYILKKKFNTRRIEKTSEKKKEIETYINILRNMINNIKEKQNNMKSIDEKLNNMNLIEEKERVYQNNLNQQKNINESLITKNDDKEKVESDIKSKNDEKQNLMRDVGSLSAQIESKKKLEENKKTDKEKLEKSKIENEKKIGQNQKEIHEKEDIISSIESVIKEKEELKRKEEQNIIDTRKKMAINTEIKKNHEKEIDEQKNEINIINNRINDLQIRKNQINVLIQQKTIEENRIQNEFNIQKSKKENIQKDAFKQLIKIILLIKEINNIQMENARKKSLQEELKIILSEFEDEKVRDSLKNLIDNEFTQIKSKLENNEQEVLEEYGINKKSLLAIKNI